MIPHNGMQVLIQLGLFDGLQFCGKEFSRKSLCEITDVYNTLFIMTKKNFKELMVKVFENEDLKFSDLVTSHYITRLMDVFNINITD